jgi:hypothetical protein
VVAGLLGAGAGLGLSVIFIYTGVLVAFLTIALVLAGWLGLVFIPRWLGRR